MSRLFLSSFFSGVRDLFEQYAGDFLHGKRVAFIPTAARNETINFYVHDGKKVLKQYGSIVDEIDVSTASHSEICRILGEADVIYVSGGNTFFLLQEFRKSGTDQMIIEHIRAGKLYIGESAGSVILAPNIEYVSALDDTRAAPELSDYESLSVLDFCPLPHYKNFPFRKAVKKAIRDYGHTLRLLPFSNNQVILFEGEKYRVVSRKDADPLKSGSLLKKEQDPSGKLHR